MKISTKGRYGLTVMIELAKRYCDKPISLKSIAKAQNLSEHYLEQIISLLRNAGLVKSIRGAYGGYILTKEPNEISAGEVITALEGSLSPIENLEDENPAQRELWTRVQKAINEVLDHTSLEDLAKLESDDLNGYMFYI
ncbi:MULTISPECIES: cysteine metabolism transcriptional regulator CymR [Bacillaceae]|jgi:Rrf2 family cysteine metabolism transcriptional repressor|uniref:Rrf2 family transcriptional regulator n=2 Tax=Gottfriedia TaxID=2837503 RepID=A0ABY4JR28_9BACI|nr:MULTISPECIES: Rrf2 family transcriptional regulator [Bacillaceae]KQL38118.1 Rrf2 family transcriptional regulator [Bacillus sp. FJAT-25509]ODG90260.1 Rrf2 family transcriptional regulator [Gottfriedia luciferensis]PEC47365.1 Rrf2 family transcriptional regulator [Bacillus sp. AFS096315]PET61290.1 Rrf2 family transcriptional regulator [Bacillus sp. AFS001701]PFH86332.1 Rrf2 family transcriptional regulator [Bacillus sp. AFS088145]